MAADYLVSSLPALEFDAPAPLSLEEFDARCREQLGADPFSRLEEKWRDLETQMRNASAEERARAREQDPSKWRRPANGCSLHWQNRIREAFAEKDPAKRERLLDKARWDAAADMTPPQSPLSREAAFTYRIRLQIALKRQSISQEAGNAAFERAVGTGRAGE
jgi:hypothetical protein